MNCENDELKKIWYLEMLHPEELNETKLPKNTIVVKLEIPLPAINRFFYEEVGRLWKWTDRLVWSDEDWSSWLENNEIETWMLLLKGTPAGYFELRTMDKEVEIAYFGLLPIFLDKKLGGGLLSKAVKIAWGMKKERVWVHTCSFDHPNALKNYIARGFRIYRKINA